MRPYVHIFPLYHLSQALKTPFMVIIYTCIYELVKRKSYSLSVKKFSIKFVHSSSFFYIIFLYLFTLYYIVFVLYFHDVFVRRRDLDQMC